MTSARYQKCKCGRMFSWLPSMSKPAKCTACTELDEKAKKAVEAVQDRPVTHKFRKGLTT